MYYCHDMHALQGLMKQVVKDLFSKFQHQAVTQDTLLCLVAAALGGCHPKDLTGALSSCSGPLASLIPPPAAEDADTETASDSSSSSERPKMCAQLVDRWLARLRAWVLGPGLPQVELHVSSAEQPGSNTTALQTYQAQLLPSRWQGQVCTWLALHSFQSSPKCFKFMN